MDCYQLKTRPGCRRLLIFLLAVFERIGLKTNDSKTKMMICLPAVKATRMTEGAYKRRLTGEGDSYHERMRRRVACPDCGDIMQLRSLPNHRRVQHGISVTALPPPPPDAPPTLYFASVPRLPARDREDVKCPSLNALALPALLLACVSISTDATPSTASVSVRRAPSR